MDLVIGRIPAVGPANDKRADQGTPVEARVLHIRQPRRSRNPDKVKDARRAPASPQADPPGARVLILLVPEAFKLPDDLDKSNYRVFLRFVKR